MAAEKDSTKNVVNKKLDLNEITHTMVSIIYILLECHKNGTSLSVFEIVGGEDSEGKTLDIFTLYSHGYVEFFVGDDGEPEMVLTNRGVVFATKITTFIHDPFVDVLSPYIVYSLKETSEEEAE